ncbi:phospholipase D family protein [Seohaeicola saemankumensis]|nr:phospholipase D family protein [Seohaeicola saemankumensis]MCA0872347.1 phospholipase D family protein [Seohaeicola saemankumensis]
MRTVFRYLAALLAVYLIATGSFRLFYGVPEADNRVDSRAIAPRDDSALGALILPLAAAHPGLSGVTNLQDGISAFAGRLQLADMAEDSLDLRYYIWQKDITGMLLLDAAKRAADRGVRVRLLLDDNGVPDIEPELAELNAHPNIEVRLFNPFVLRSPRMATYLLDFGRINRRMHNKSFTVDGLVTLVGGRNIGDIYFSRDQQVNYFDLDVVALGQAAQDVSEDFDLYWASPSAVSADLLLAPAADGTLDATLEELRADPGNRAFEQTARELPIAEELTDNARAFDWVEMTLVSDDPAKGQGPVPDSDLMSFRLREILPPVHRQVLLISAYFVPGPWLTGVLSDWAASGIDVRTLTNAQEATDVLPVHSGYRRYRDQLVHAGVNVYELKAQQNRRDLAEQFGLIGSTNSSLHAKTFVLDRETLFVGSFNFDPRSARLNTEMGFLIKSPRLSELVGHGFDNHLAGRAYLVEQDTGGNLIWRDTLADGPDRIHDTEPGTTALSRALVRVIGWMPVEWLL